MHAAPDAAFLQGFNARDPAAWTVLGDWLTARGDPRGLLLALEAGAKLEGDTGELERLRRRHLPRYVEALCSVFGVADEAALARAVELRWRCGLVTAARLLEPAPGATDPTPDPTVVRLRGLLDSEAALVLTALRCDRVDPRSILAALVGGRPRPTIRALTLGDYRTPMPALDRLWPVLQGLRELELLGPQIAIDELAEAAPRLTELTLACELDPTPLRAFAGPPFPRLRKLTLRLGGDDYFGARQHADASRDEGGSPLAVFAGLLAGVATPALDELTIAGVAFGDELAAALSTSPLRARLRRLDILDSQFADQRNAAPTQEPSRRARNDR